MTIAPSPLRFGKLASALLYVLAVTGCAAVRVPENAFETSGAQEPFMAEWRSDYRDSSLPSKWAAAENEATCTASVLPDALAAVPLADATTHPEGPRLAAGDMLRLTVEDDDLFSGNLVISASGTVALRHVGSVSLAGLSMPAAEDLIEETFVRARIYRPGYASATLRVNSWAAIDVGVEGALFQPGIVTINDLPAEAVRADKAEAAGDHAIQRRLSAALRAAGGVRPDADLSQVVVIRGGQRSTHDLSGILNGETAADPFLMSGDKIFVPTQGCFDGELARPSPVTLPGIRIFLSNLTVPARANAASAISQHATSVPYGTTLFQALFSANCVGGTQVTNAGRFAILSSRDPLTGEAVVIQRAVEDLVRRSDRDQFNPVLMPYDAIACYDSVVTNVRDVLAMMGEVAGPSVLTLGLIKATD